MEVNMKSKKINKKLTKDNVFAIFAATVVIFTAFLNTWLSVGIAMGALITALIYKLYKE
jgi:4-hydroxybenzoate polyprenyltransferase